MKTLKIVAKAISPFWPQFMTSFAIHSWCLQCFDAVG